MNQFVNRKIPNAGKIFMFDGVPWMRIVPAKRLFNSTMIHEVVNRGDMFAVSLLTGVFTVLPEGVDTDDMDNDKSMTQPLPEWPPVKTSHNRQR